jgi:hypothetical protein
MALRSTRKASAPISSTELKGKVSWFGGPKDSTDSGHTALGLTTATPGIAVYDQSTLGGYWKVTTANGRSHVIRQTDIGPAPWTGRVVDITYSALDLFGYSEGNFPTDSAVTAIYLGKDKQSAETKGGTDTVGKVEGEVTGERKDVVIAPNLLGKALGGIFGVLENPGYELSVLTLEIIKDVGVGIMDLIIAPAWHLNQRTVASYSNFILGGKLSNIAAIDPKDTSLQWALPWTAAFWGLGYALLWTDPESGSLKPVGAHKSAAAKHVRRLQAIPARKAMIKPKDVKSKTPTKPQTSSSTADLHHISTLKADRPRTVKVEQRGTGLRPTQPRQAPVSRVKIEKDGTIKRIDNKPAKPNAPAHARQGARKASGATSKGPAKARGKRRR